MKAVLKIIKDSMDALEINYAFMELKKKPVYPYFIGEYQETESMNEDGLQESTFILSGFSRGSWMDLENAKDKIAKHFPSVGGKLVIAEGSAVAIFYANSLVIQNEDAELKRIQINLTVKEWKV